MFISKTQQVESFNRAIRFVLGVLIFYLLVFSFLSQQWATSTPDPAAQARALATDFASTWSGLDFDLRMLINLCLLSIPLGLAVVIYGTFSTVLRYWVPLTAAIAIAVGGPVILFFVDQYHAPANWFSGIWYLLTILLGIPVFLVGFVLTMKESVLVRVFLNLVAATFFTLFVTVTYPFLLLLGGLYLKAKSIRDLDANPDLTDEQRKERALTLPEVFGESRNLYHFFILNVYPIFFSILPGLLLVRSQAKRERKRARRFDEPPRYRSELDFNRLEIGDVILTGRPSWSSSGPIQTANFLSVSQDYRYWSHAVIYSGDGYVIEAQSEGKGVQEIHLETGQRKTFDKDGNGEERSLAEIRQLPEGDRVRYLDKSYFDEGYFLMVLRHKFLKPKERRRVVDYCRKKAIKRSQYDTWGVSFYSLSALIPPMLSGWLQSRIADKIFNVEDAYFCSELVAEAYEQFAAPSDPDSEVWERIRRDYHIFDRVPWRVKPLDFRFNPLFREVDAGYKRIPQNESAEQEVAGRLEELRDLHERIDAEITRLENRLKELSWEESPDLMRRMRREVIELKSHRSGVARQIEEARDGRYPKCFAIACSREVPEGMPESPPLSSGPA